MHSGDRSSVGDKHGHMASYHWLTTLKMAYSHWFKILGHFNEMLMGLRFSGQMKRNSWDTWNLPLFKYLIWIIFYWKEISFPIVNNHIHNLWINYPKRCHDEGSKLFLFQVWWRTGYARCFGDWAFSGLFLDRTGLYPKASLFYFLSFPMLSFHISYVYNIKIVI